MELVAPPEPKTVSLADFLRERLARALEREDMDTAGRLIKELDAAINPPTKPCLPRL